ncbi:hypothetical protein [Streptomyces sp. NBC_01518]
MREARGEGDKGPLGMTITFLDLDKPAKGTPGLAELMKDARG